MSDHSQGPGWWYASDGKWYPPESQPAPAQPAQPAQPAAPEASDPNAPTWDGTQWVYPTPAPAPAPASAPVPAPASSGSSHGALFGLLAIVLVMLVVAAGIVFLVRGRSGGSGTAGTVNSDAVPSGPDELPSKDVTLGDKTVVVRGNGGKTLKSVASDGTTFTLDGGADGVDKLAAGSVLLLTGVTVVKITSVDKSGGDVVVKTEPAAITDVIKDGTLTWDNQPTGPGTLNVWDARPEDVEVKDKSQSTPDSTDKPNSSRFSPTQVIPGMIPGAVGVHAQADAITKSGKVGDYTYSYNQTGGADGSSTYQISISKEGNYVVKLDLDASIDPIISSGDIHVEGSTLDKLHIKSDKFNGKAKVHIEAGTGEDIAPVKQEILSLPIEVKYPIVIYGIPFYIGIKGKFLIEPAFTSKNSTIKATGEASFGGSAGLTFEGGSLSAEGALVTKREDPLQYLDGLGVGVTGMVYAAQFPRVSFGLGYGGASAGVYLASTTSIGATVGSAIGMIPCKQVSITETVSAGADAKFLGIDLPLGDKAKAEITKKTWGFYDPKVEACKIEDAEN